MSKYKNTLIVEVESYLGASIDTKELKLTHNFPWSVKLSGNNVTFKLGSGSDKKKEIHKTKNVRKLLLKNYNWNGIVKLLELVEEEDDDFTYTRPLNLNGIAKHDDPLIIPNDAIEAIIRLQAKYQIEDKYSDAPDDNIDNILKDVNGDPNETFVKDILDKEYLDILKGSENTDMEYDGISFSMPNISTSTEADIYDFLRNIVLARKGLWSDSDNITNFISIRRKLEKSKSKYNDTLFVAMKEGGVKIAKQYIGSTEPGNLRSAVTGQLLAQSLTAIPGIHTGGKSSTVGFRTRTAMRTRQTSSAEYFEPNDTTMNVHFGHPGITNTKYLELKNNQNKEGSKGIKYNSTETEAYLTIIRVLRILTQWGAGGKRSAYKNLVRNTKSFEISDIKTNSSSKKYIEISQGSKVLKKLYHKDYKSFIKKHYSESSDKAVSKVRKQRLISILKDYDGAYSDVTYKSRKHSDLKSDVYKDDVWKHIIKIQALGESNIKKIDAKPGKGTIKKLELSDMDEYNMTKIQPKAIGDLEELDILFKTWSENSKLKSMKHKTKDLKEHFKEKFHVNKVDYKIDKALSVDKVGGKGMDKDVSVWSEGCQVVYGAQNYYSFLYNLTKHLENTKQERWYYSIIEIESITGAAK